MKDLNHLFVGKANFQLCEYFGGKKKGAMIQITSLAPDNPGYVQLTGADVVKLDVALDKWLTILGEKKEEPKED